MFNEKSRNLLVRKRIIDSAEGRLVGVTEEFSKAFDILEKFERTVSIFGSARVLPTTSIYQDAVKLSTSLANKGYVIVTGGGGGIMEAANKGAFETGNPSIGFNIQLPTEQVLNEYTTEHYSFEHFFGRKVALTLNANAYVYFPGGFGTLDELFEILTLQQTSIIPKVPTILYDSKFWQPIAHVIDQTLGNEYRTIHPQDTSLYTITDSIDKVVQLIEDHRTDAYNLPVAKNLSRLVG